MNKKLMVIVGLFILLCVIGILVFLFFHSKDVNLSRNNGDTNVENGINGSERDDNLKVRDGRILVVYYTATNNTKDVALKIANNLNADLFEIKPKKEYDASDLDWTNERSRVSMEHDDESLRDVELVTTKVDNWNSYDVVLIGYPIWWGVAAWPVNTFVKENDFTGKTVIPFCTSASSGLGESGKLLEELAGNGNWMNGHRFSSSATDADVKSFTDSIK